MQQSELERRYGERQEAFRAGADANNRLTRGKPTLARVVSAAGDDLYIVRSGALASNTNSCSGIDEMKGARFTVRRKSKDAYRYRGAPVKMKPQPLFHKARRQTAWRSSKISSPPCPTEAGLPAPLSTFQCQDMIAAEECVSGAGLTGELHTCDAVLWYSARFLRAVVPLGATIWDSQNH